MTNYTCDSCGRDFKIRIKTEKLERDIEKVYFKCPRCKQEYIAYYTDVDIRAKQERMKILENTHGLAQEANNTKFAQRLESMMKRYKTEIEYDMYKLQLQIES